jgi:hypothetical protein
VITPLREVIGCGVNGSIPFIKIADRVEVTIAFQAKRVSGPPVIFDQ